MYQFRWLAVPNLLSAFVCLYLALFVLKRKQNRLTLFFTLFVTGTFLWQFANAFVLMAGNAELANVWCKIAYAGVIFIPIGMCLFAFSLVDIRITKSLLVAIYAPGFVFLTLFLTTDWFLEGANKYPWGFWFRAGKLHPVYLAFLFALLLLGPYLLFLKARTIQEERQQHIMRMVFRAFVIGSFGSIDILPDYRLNVVPLGFIPTLIAALIFAYLAVFKEFMEIVVVNWSGYFRVRAILNTLTDYKQYLQEILNLAGITRGDRVLGAGLEAQDLANPIWQRQASYVGIAQEEPAIPIVEKNLKPGAHDFFLLADPVKGFDFHSQSFEKIICTSNLHLLDAESRAKTFQEFKRVLKPKGTLVVTVPSKHARPLQALWPHIKKTAAREGVLPALLCASRQFFSFLKLSYYDLVIMEKALARSVPRIDANGLLALMRQSGFVPVTIKKTYADQRIVCAGILEEQTHLDSAPPSKLSTSVISAFEQAIGSEHVITDPAALKRYQSSTLPIERIIDAVLRPASAEEVQAIVGIANEFGVPLYSISTGHNWGYGSTLPVEDHNVVVDLGRMNRILEINEELAYCVVEPGVTFGQLALYLEEHRIPLWIDPIGSGPHCSLIGNALERGFGFGLYGDHFLSSCGMEIVLASGKVLRTSFGHFDGAKATHVFKWGIGPYLDGLFTQSNFGIVTKMGLWLMPKPEHVELCCFNLRDEQSLISLINDSFRPLVLHGVFSGSLKLIHQTYALTMLRQYPWDEAQGKIPLLDSAINLLARQRKLGVWVGTAPLYGTKAQVQATKQAVRKALRGKVDKLIFISSKTIKFLSRFKQPLSLLLNINIPEILKLLKVSYGMATGRPHEKPLEGAYWRNTRAFLPTKDINPDKDNCGVLWFSPIIPLNGGCLEELLSIVRPICKRHGFETCIGLTTVTRRAFDCVLPILYDRDNLKETQKAQDCYDDLLRSCLKAGYVPYRLGIQSMAEVTNRPDVFWDTIESLKKALDPNGIISPGRYSR